MCVRLWEAAGKAMEAKAGADRSGSSLPCSNSASHTSLQLGTLPLLINKSWRMRGAHIVLTAVRSAFSITHYYHIHIHFHWHASFPSTQIKPKRMQKGREGRHYGERREKGGVLMMKCRPRPQLIAFQFACKWFSVRAGPISWGVNWGRGWETTLIYCPGTRRCRLPWVTKMPAGFIHKSTHRKKKMISCTHELTLCKEYACAWTLSQSWMTAYLSGGQFPQEVGTAGPAPLSSDDLTEKKTDWINIVIMWPCGVHAGFLFIITHWKL